MARLPHNIEKRALWNRDRFPYRGWTAKRGTLYYISRTDDRKGWRAAPAIAAHADEPPYLYARTLADVGAHLATF